MKETYTVLAVVSSEEIIKEAAKIILFLTDNTTARAVVNRRSYPKTALNDLAKQISAVVTIRGLDIVAMHLAGELNIIADSLSRSDIIHECVDHYPNRTLTKNAWHNLVSTLPQLNFEAFAEHGSHRLTHYATTRNPVFEDARWKEKDMYSWWFPPDFLLFDCLKYLNKLS